MAITAGEHDGDGSGGNDGDDGVDGGDGVEGGDGCSSEAWQKVLWKTQRYPDNYTDSSFLENLVVNAHVPVRRYGPVALAATAVAQQMCTVAAAGAATAHLHARSFSAAALLCAAGAVLVAGYLVCLLLGRHVLGGSLARGLWQCGMLVSGIYFLSPLLRSLARTVSADSVVALACALLTAHLALHDYHFVSCVTEQLRGALSLVAAVAASLLLASLLPTDLDVFAHMLFSLEAYLLLPYVRRYVRGASIRAHVALTLCMAGGAAAMLAPLSPALAAAFAAAVASVALLCPWCLLSIHKFKAKINGPWDEAVPHIPTELWEAGPG